MTPCFDEESKVFAFRDLVDDDDDDGKMDKHCLLFFSLSFVTSNSNGDYFSY